ncbi:hypothetical protein [Streptomyces sp. ODS05-4]|uniref:hypothetical protein n=1 Tax=Streptomyces sp. ODS05-4 TaxID=2944939 RepID=UPI00210BFF76|nr:hypothetical protein [Streptomyces sp. ODS05-4]
MVRGLRDAVVGAVLVAGLVAGAGCTPNGGGRAAPPAVSLTGDQVERALPAAVGGAVAWQPQHGYPVVSEDGQLSAYCDNANPACEGVTLFGRSGFAAKPRQDVRTPHLTFELVVYDTAAHAERGVERWVAALQKREDRELKRVKLTRKPIDVDSGADSTDAWMVEKEYVRMVLRVGAVVALVRSSAFDDRAEMEKAARLQVDRVRAVAEGGKAGG